MNITIKTKFDENIQVLRVEFGNTSFFHLIANLRIKDQLKKEVAFIEIISIGTLVFICWQALAID